MSLLKSYFQGYEEYHQTYGNKITHYFGIPMIVLGLLGLLSFIKIGQIDAALIFWIVCSLFYIRLNLKLGILFSFFTFAIYYFALQLDLLVHIFLFLIGWAVQFVGHIKYEKKSPAFLTNLTHLLIGPLWIFNHLMKKLKIINGD